MAKRYIFTAVIFCLWILGFYLATEGISGVELLNVLKQVSPFAILLGIGCYILATGAGMVTLSRCMGYMGLRPPKKGIAKAWIFGSFVDNIMPTITPIGEAGMAYFLEKFYRVSYAKALAGIGIYVSSWAISTSIFATIAVFLVHIMVGIPAAYVVPIVVAVSLFILVTVGWLLLMANKKLVGNVVCKLLIAYKVVSNKLMKRKVSIERCLIDLEFEKSYGSLEQVMKNKKQIMGNALLLVVPQLAHVFCLYFLILGFGIEVSFFSVLMVHIVSTVMGLLALIPSGLGVYEGTSIAGFAGILGIEGSIAFGVVFLYRLIFVWFTNLIGGLVGIIQVVEETANFVKP